MPYYVTDEMEDCAGWAVITDIGEIVGCHLEKQDAVDQMVAVSIDEGIEPGGEITEDDDDMESTKPTTANAYAGRMIIFTAGKVQLQAGYGMDEEDETKKAAAPRTISGVAVPYNVEATVSGGERVKFLPGSLPTEGKAPRLLESHDANRIVGIVTAREETADGMRYTARISATKAGDDVIELIKDGALDAVSVGVDPVDAQYDDKGVLVVSKATWRELSIVAEPAFPNATIDSIAAAKVELNESEITAMNTEVTATEKPAEAPKRVPGRLPSASEWISAFVRGGEQFAAVNRMIAEHQAYHNPLEAAAGDQTTGDQLGLLPIPVVGPVYTNINYLRPVVTAIGARAMPLGSGKVFIRPEITTHTSVAQQSSELSGLSSTTMVVTDNQVTRLTFGGTALVSEQSIDWTDPNSVNILLQDMAGQYADATDNYAADQLRSNSTDQGTWAGTAASILSEIYAAAQLIAANTNVLPTHLFVDPEMWAKLGGLVDGSNRPLFPTVGPFNAAGQQNAATWNGNPLGLTMVVDKNFTAKTAIVGCAAGQFAGFEIYENQRGIIAIDKPEVLGRQISFRGYFATLMIDATKFRRFTYA
jgi:HK97 family phage prohead protease